MILNETKILSELGISDEVLAIYPYGSKVYGTDDEYSDSDFIIVMKSGMLSDGSFKSNAISNSDRTIQGVLYSRGGFIDAINNYDISVMECLSLPKDKVIKDVWGFKLPKIDSKAMGKSIISKASNSLHICRRQHKFEQYDLAKRGLYHSLRVLDFGLQLKEYGSVIDLSSTNGLFKQITSEDDNTPFDTYMEYFGDYIDKLRS